MKLLKIFIIMIISIYLLINFNTIKKYTIFTYELIESINKSYNELENNTPIISKDYNDVKIYMDYTIQDLDILMKYHGVNRVIITNSKESPYFYRDNQKIYVFNNYAINYIEKIKEGRD